MRLQKNSTLIVAALLVLLAISICYNYVMSSELSLYQEVQELHTQFEQLQHKVDQMDIPNDQLGSKDKVSRRVSSMEEQIRDIKQQVDQLKQDTNRDTDLYQAKQDIKHCNATLGETK